MKIDINRIPIGELFEELYHEEGFFFSFSASVEPDQAVLTAERI